MNYQLLWLQPYLSQVCWLLWLNLVPKASDQFVYELPSGHSALLGQCG